MDPIQSVALGAGIGAFRSVQSWIGTKKTEPFELRRCLKTATNAAWQGALLGVFVRDPIQLFGAVFFSNVTLYEAYKAYKGK